MNDALLQLENVTTALDLEQGTVHALDDVSFTIRAGETLGVVGESGCGKSLTALSIMRLLAVNGTVVRGSIRFDGQDLLRKSPAEMRQIRGNEISMIFQEPMTSLNPVYTVGNQLMEAIRLHQKVGSRAARAIAVEALSTVGIPLPEKRIGEYPHQLSGGMRQRVMIAMALACRPKLLIADEPTTALDVTIQAQILRLIRKLRTEIGMAVMLITHDLGVVAGMCDRIVVMYAGKIVEKCALKALFSRPRHPYAQGLLAAIPRIDGPLPRRLPVIRGIVPQLFEMPAGCRFHPRCPDAMAQCRESEPPLMETDTAHWAACWKYGGKRA